MDWRTELPVNPSKNKITHANKIFTIGSCFAEEIGSRLKANKFHVLNNPFGTVYNPISIQQLLYYSLFKIFPRKDMYAQNGDIHFHYDFHSSFSSLNGEEVKNKVRDSITTANQFFENTQTLIITYGTAFAYCLISKDLIVANCHKMPSGEFDKLLLTEERIVSSFKYFYRQLKTNLPSLRIILTVSPVRHLKDTLELNSVSKSILRTACHVLSQELKDVEYFPAYELLLDDLRDYRFYKTDRIHPTDEAVDYIWSKFAETYFDEPTRKFVSDWGKIKAEIAHRPFRPESADHQKFLKSLLKKLENLPSQIDVSSELTNIKSQMANSK